MIITCRSIVLLLANLTFGSEPPRQPTSSLCIKCCGGFGWRPTAPCQPQVYLQIAASFPANSVIDACTVNAFKARLDKFWRHQLVKFDLTADLTGTRNRSEELIKWYCLFTIVYINDADTEVSDTCVRNSLSSWVLWSVCVSRHREPCKNGCTNRRDVWQQTQVGPKTMY